MKVLMYIIIAAIIGYMIFVFGLTWVTSGIS